MTLQCKTPETWDAFDDPRTALGFELLIACSTEPRIIRSHCIGSCGNNDRPKCTALVGVRITKVHPDAPATDVHIP